MLLTTTFLALNFIPLLTKTGNSNAETADVSVEIDPVLSLTLSENEIRLNPNPVPEGTFIHDTLSAIVDTNNKTGYTLTMNTEEEETALAQEDGVTKIDSLANEVTVTNTNQSNFTMNHWGYALTDTISDSETSFLKIPALSTPDTIKTSDAPVSDDTTPVTLATRVDTSLPSGTYKNTLVFTAIANPITEPIKNFFDITTMQEMTAETCNTVDTPSKDAVTSVTALAEYTNPNTQVPEVTLTDTRDNETYTVRKLADGNCWMTQNLRIVGPRTLTSADSDVSSNFTLPAHSTGAWASSDFDSTGANTARVYNTGSTEYGAYYNWYTAVAGSANYDTEDTNAPYSICPKGWKLPLGGNNTDSGSFSYLSNAYPGSIVSYGIWDSSSPLWQVFGVSLSGYYYYSGSVYDQGSNGFLWTSSSNSYNVRAYSMFYLSTYFGPDYYSVQKVYGFSVRCVAR